jgi:hypothetical protein
MKLIHTSSAALLFAGLLLAPVASHAQNKPADIQPKSVEGKTATQDHWDPNQIITATVHQAWVLSGKNEATFFEMVEQLADICAKNRGIALPESEAAGRRMGEYIKHAASTDSDQLLYAIVDKAVRMATKAQAKAPAPAAAAK